jgi:tetratricopeptide (TPR) repeat protein
MAESNVPTDEAKPPAHAETAVPPRRSILHVFARLGILGSLFLLALALSWLIRANVTEEAEIPEIALEPPRPPLKKTDSAGSALEHLALGDQALQHHLYAKALSHFEDLLTADRSAAAIVEYRIGLCLESLGQVERALVSYGRSVTASTSPTLTFASHLAMARCLLRAKQPAQARRLLYPYTFDTSSRGSMPEDFRADARILIALACGREIQEAPAPGNDPDRELGKDLMFDRLVSMASIPLEIPFYLEEVGLPVKKAKETEISEEKPAPALTLRTGTDKSPAMILTMNQPDMPPLEVLDMLAHKLSLRLDVSARAKNTLADRSLRVCLRNEPLLDFLEQVADNFELACRVDGEAIRIVLLAELDARQQDQAQRALVGHMLQRASREDADHEWMPAVYLELGNLEINSGRVTEAAQCYQQILNEAPGSAYVAPAYYNLALLRARKREYARARKMFFKVVDQAAGHELALRAQIRIGQLYMEGEENELAITQLKHARIMAPKSPYQPFAGLVLAAVYLKDGQLEQARLTLANQRAQLQKAPFKGTAAKANKSGRREAGELLSLLWHDQDETLLGSVGQFLMAQAYRDLGIWDQAERLLRQATKNADGPLIAGLQYLLADTLTRQNRFEEAGGLFEKLAAGPSAYRARAVFRLAQLDLQTERLPECLQKCQQLWSEHSFGDTAALLQLWGNALEKSGEFTKAAQCFNGQAPI